MVQVVIPEEGAPMSPTVVVKINGVDESQQVGVPFEADAQLLAALQQSHIADNLVVFEAAGSGVVGNFASATYTINGATVPVSNILIARTDFQDARGDNGGLLTVTPGVGAVSSAPGDGSQTRQAAALGDGAVADLLASGGVVVVLTAHLAWGAPLTVGPFTGYEINFAIGMFNGGITGPMVSALVENVNDGSQHRTGALTDTQGLYSPAAFTGDGTTVKIAARVGVDGAVAASVNGGVVQTGLSDQFDVDFPALFVGLFTRVTGFNQIASVTFTDVSIDAYTARTNAELPGLSA